MAYLSEEQKSTIESATTELQVVQFVPQDKVDGFLSMTINNENNSHRFVLNMDMALSGIIPEGGPLPFAMVVVDAFPNGISVVQYLNETQPSYALVLTPESSMRTVKLLRFLKPILSFFFPLDSNKELKKDLHLNQPERNATQATLDDFQKNLNQDEPFYNINLNRYYATPNGEPKHEYYAKFSQDTAKATGPYVLGLGGYPAVSGQVLTTVGGGAGGDHQQENTQLHDDWDNFVLVYYPHRSDYIKLIPNLPEDIVRARETAYERGVQIPCSNVL